MQNLKRGQTTEYTGNILYETEGERFQAAIREIINQFDPVDVENFDGIPSYDEKWKILKKMFDGIEIDEDEGLQQIVDKYMDGGSGDDLYRDIGLIYGKLKDLERPHDFMNVHLPPHTDYEQVRGAAEVFNLISSDPVTDNEISYEQRREYALSLIHI